MRLAVLMCLLALLAVGCEQSVAPPTQTVPERVTMTEFKAPAPAVPSLPAVDGRKWQFTLLYHDDTFQHDRDVALWKWVMQDPVVKGIHDRCSVHYRTPSDLFYKIGDGKNSWEKFTRGELPALILQDPFGNRVYTAVGDGLPGVPDNGSPIVAVPGGPDALATQLCAAIESWKSFAFAADALYRAENGEGVTSEGPEVLFPILRQRRQEIYQECFPILKKKQEEERPAPDEKADATADLAKLKALADVNVNVQKETTPVVAQSVRAGPPAWFFPVLVIGAILALVGAIGGGIVRHIMSPLNE